jgi:hypothetical protein
MAQLPAVAKDLLAGFKKAATRQELNTSEGSYLKLDKTGTWLYGADEIEVEPSSRWAINPQTMATGFAAWDDTEKVGEEMAPLTSDTPIIRTNLPDVVAQWSPQTAMQLKCVDGEDEGTEVLYSTTSKGGTKAFKVMVAAITAKIESGSAEMIPIVELEHEHYKHKKYGKIFTPVLKVVDWMGLDALPEPEKDTPEPEPEAEEEKPRARRRQRKS